MNAAQVADVMKAGVSDATDYSELQTFYNLCTSVALDLGLTWLDPTMGLNALTEVVRSAITSRLDRIAYVASYAAAAGILLPDNPIPQLAVINRTRRLYGPFPAGFDMNAATTAISELNKITADYDAGTISFARTASAAQIASFDVSVDGISQQSGDALTDILGYQPDADFVKRKQALDSLSKLDFSKRKPYILFTADVIRDGKRQDGTLICWQRMHDAVSYTISKRDVFAMTDIPHIVKTNADLDAATGDLLGDANFQQIMSFYDWIKPGDFYAFVDADVHPDTLYSYVVTGVQVKAPSSPFIFDVAMSSLYLTAAQIAAVKQTIAENVGAGHIDSVSPYPAIAKIIYGDESYGWILAGCNIVASQRRGDTFDVTRALSYIGSKASFVLSEAASGRFMVPNDVNLIHSAIDSAITSYGVSQTILSTLVGTGMTLFMSGKDDPLGFQPTTESLTDVTGGLAKVLSAIDPQTATLDPHVLSTSLVSHASPIVHYQPIGISTVIGPQLTAVGAEEIFSGPVLDLTVYSGISGLMQLLRSVYDFYPGALA